MMLLVVIAILGGAVVGFALGGRLRRLGELRLSWWPLAFLGLALQLLPIPLDSPGATHATAVGLLIASYLTLLVFLVRNLRVPGIPIIAVGFALNALVIGVNGGMPVRDGALRTAAGSRYERTLRRLTIEGGAKHHLQRPGDDLVLLSDVIPVGAPVREVLSIGDLVWLLGSGWVIAAAMSPRGGRGKEPARPPRAPGSNGGGTGP
jgi:uncharacterized protein DUF5317